MNLQENIRRILREERTPSIYLIRRLDMLDYEVKKNIKGPLTGSSICIFFKSDIEYFESIMENSIDAMYYKHFSNIDDGSGEWAHTYLDMVDYIKKKHKNKIMKHYDDNCGSGLIPLKESTRRVLSEDTDEYRENVRVKISDIQPTNRDGQSIEDAIINVKDGLTSYSQDPPFLLKRGDKYEILDGFHRIAQKILDGKKYVTSDVMIKESIRKVLREEKLHATPQELIKNLPKELKELLFKQWDAKQNPEWHPEGNTLKHIIVVIKRAYHHYPDDPNMVMAALFHDLGKIDTYKINPKTNQPTAYGHEDKSTDYVEKFKDWIESFEGMDVEEIKYLVKNHMKVKPSTWDQMKDKKKEPIMSHPAFDKLMGFTDKLDGGGTDLKESIRRILREGYIDEGTRKLLKVLGYSNEYIDNLAAKTVGNINFANVGDALLGLGIRSYSDLLSKASQTFGKNAVDVTADEIYKYLLKNEPKIIEDMNKKIAILASEAATKILKKKSVMALIGEVDPNMVVELKNLLEAPLTGPGSIRIEFIQNGLNFITELISIYKKINKVIPDDLMQLNNDFAKKIAEQRLQQKAQKLKLELPLYIPDVNPLENRVQIRLGRNKENHFGKVQNIIIKFDGKDITSEDDVVGLGKMNIVIKDNEIIVGDIFIPEKYRNQGIATVVYQKISDHFGLPIFNSTTKGFNQTMEGGYIWKNREKFEPRNLQEQIRRILREETKIKPVLNNILNMLFDGFDDIYYDWAQYNCGMGVCCDPYAVGFVLPKNNYDDYLFKLVDGNNYDDNGKYFKEVMGELPEVCYEMPDVKNPNFNFIVFYEEFVEEIEDYLGPKSNWKMELLDLINKKFGCKATNIMFI